MPKSAAGDVVVDVAGQVRLALDVRGEDFLGRLALEQGASGEVPRPPPAALTVRVAEAPRNGGPDDEEQPPLPGYLGEPLSGSAGIPAPHQDPSAGGEGDDGPGPAMECFVAIQQWLE